MASTINPISLVGGSLLTTSVQSFYSVQQGYTVEILQCAFMNIDTQPHVVTLWISANSILGQNQYMVWSGTLAPGQSWSVDQAIGRVIAAGATIQAQADTSSVVTFSASGLQTT